MWEGFQRPRVEYVGPTLLHKVAGLDVENVVLRGGGKVGGVLTEGEQSEKRLLLF